MLLTNIHKICYQHASNLGFMILRCPEDFLPFSYMAPSITESQSPAQWEKAEVYVHEVIGSRSGSISVGRDEETKPILHMN